MPNYSRTPLFRSPKGNGKKLEIAGFRNNQGKVKFVNSESSFNKIQYRKRPCISRTFFHKIEAKNQGCGLSMDTSVFGVLKNLINIHKTSSGAEK